MSQNLEAARAARKVAFVAYMATSREDVDVFLAARAHYYRAYDAADAVEAADKKVAKARRTKVAEAIVASDQAGWDRLVIEAMEAAE